MNTLILGGFLGSGKTTVLMQLARYIVNRGSKDDDEGNGKKVVILENEIGESGIDDKFLRSGGFRVEDLFSGCACCTISGEMVGAADRIRKEFDPDWLIVETTGLAYPRLIKENLKAALGIDSRTCILADASRWKRMLIPLSTLLSGQIVGSDIVLTNKADLANEDTLVKIEADIAGFDASPEIIRITAINTVSDEVWAKVFGE
jgi:G3E family GTPase